ncbi:MAG: nitrate- and nitrite sensing domain-containing protein [Actinobacteria bacterium]|nr:nitrate- and nitrite sensing domain-containing protein [Actinomycetota bacterium]MBO0834295.1 nitrate- and nitrite sensing domain-containing protein [Actinomycetota bacterium]
MGRRQLPRPPRTRSIRTTIAGLLVLPVVALAGLWALLATITVGNALTEYSEHHTAITVGAATETLLVGLETERTQTFIWLSSPKGTSTQALTASRRADVAAVAAYDRLYPKNLPSRHAVMGQLGKIAGIRAAVDARTLSATTAFQDFSGIVDGLFSALLSTTVPDVSVQEHTVGAIDMGQALEEFSREVTLSAATEFDGGNLPARDVALFASAVSDQRLALQHALAQGDQQLRANLLRLYNSPLHRSLAALEDQMTASAGHPPTLTLVAWRQQSQAFLNQFEQVAAAAPMPVAAEAGQVSRTLFIQAGLAAGLGLAAVVGVALLMLRFGRRIRTELTGLHDGAQAMASERLPALVKRLSEGDDVDVAAASPPLPTGKITEIVRVAESFSAVQRTAVDAAVGQASMRKGVSKVFVNLSLRTQSILHRQLGMLDALERATDDPGALADLFRLDHLTTRMRRHAESLIVLSGAPTGRSWREPVRLVDVLRAAVAEVEDYTRIEVVGESAAAVVGPTANDVVHLLAELMENATSFSPPTTRVEARIEEVGTGVAVEIEDRGLGLTRSELAAINARLASPPGFDLVVSDHLGLFVVGQLALRHGISVALRRSHYGGVTAVVLLPHAIIVPPGEGSAPELTGILVPSAARPGTRNGSAHSLAAAAGAAGHHGARGPFEPPRHQGYGSELGDTYRGLPRRVRQASLAPQLDNRRAPAPGLEPSASELTAEPPDVTRSKLSSLQDGWQRGRTAELDWPGGPGDMSGQQFTDADDGDPT